MIFVFTEATVENATLLLTVVAERDAHFLTLICFRAPSCLREHIDSSLPKQVCLSCNCGLFTTSFATAMAVGSTVCK